MPLPLLPPRARSLHRPGVLAAAALGMALSAQASLASVGAGPALECPAQLQVQQIAEPATDGWQSSGSRKAHPLVGLAFFAGPPEQKAQLAPTRERAKGKTPSATWVLERRDEPYWVACEYGGTTAIAARALAQNVTACTVEYDPRFSTPVLKRWSCQYGTP